MQAEEIIKRLEAATQTVQYVRDTNGTGEFWDEALDDLWMAVRKLPALLPTGEERLALVALRAGFGADMRACGRHGWRWVLHYTELVEAQAKVLCDTWVDVGGRDYAGYDTPLAALAAAARALSLEEEEKRG